MLYDDQSPWLAVLETLHICFSRARHQRPIFPGPGVDANGQGEHEWVNYDAPLALGLRHLLFNDQHIDEIATSGVENSAMWSNWIEELGAKPPVDVPHLRKTFPQFQDLANAVALLRSGQVDGNSSRRPTSRHLLPLGSSMLFADVKEVAHTSDRRFMRRTGELMYLMINRSKLRIEIATLVQNELIGANSPWNRLARKLMGGEAYEDVPRSLNTGFLPLPYHEAYERLAEDWRAILSLKKMPVATSLASLARLSGFNLLLYIVERAVEVVEGADGHVPPYVLDMVGSTSGNGLRKLSEGMYQRHRRLLPEAMRTFVEVYRDSEEWEAIEVSEQASMTARNTLEQRFLWKRDIGSDPYNMPSASEQIEVLLNEVQKPRSHSVSAMYVAHSRQIGAITARAGVGTWYAPNDELIEALVLANVTGPVELDSFLHTLFKRYRIVIGAQEAMLAFNGELPEVDASFRENERSFEDRLRMLGFLERKSDDCAFVFNPFHPDSAMLTDDDLDDAA
ncbi:hypothetical protein [Sphingomonas sp.]|uniref:hypothetical protein n=1 Tax=Sphingomonas sp. TaxID=28214 RepID=UPI0025F07E6D|nr:hypothetical protein [Sphingomonas sp.]